MSVRQSIFQSLVLSVAQRGGRVLPSPVGLPYQQQHQQQCLIANWEMSAQPYALALVQQQVCWLHTHHVTLLCVVPASANKVLALKCLLHA